MRNKLIKTLFVYLFLTLMLQIIFEGMKISDNVILYTIGNTVIYLCIICAIYMMHRKEINKMFIKYKSNWKKHFKDNIFTWIIGFLIMMLTNYLISLILPSNLTENEIMVRELYQKYLLATVISNIIFAPILEEFVFRLGFNRINNNYLFIGISSLLFGLLHAAGSIDSFISIIYILPYFSLGVTFSIVYTRSENVFDSILIHAIHNAVVLCMYFIF